MASSAVEVRTTGTIPISVMKERVCCLVIITNQSIMLKFALGHGQPIRLAGFGSGGFPAKSGRAAPAAFARRNSDRRELLEVRGLARADLHAIPLRKPGPVLKEG